MAAVANVWTQMDYVPPRGQCNFSKSVLSPRCPCLRFMLHPLKSASSYDCDGCGHHASFHSMENKMDDETRKRWEQEAKEKVEREEEAQQRPKKRTRAIEYSSTIGRLLQDGGPSTSNNRSRSKPRTGAARKPNRLTGAASKDRGMESADDGTDDVVELD